MSNLTAAGSTLPNVLRGHHVSSRRQGERQGQRLGERKGEFAGIVPTIAALLRGIWLRRRRHEILVTLRRVDERLLRDAGIEPCEIEEIVDGLLARWR